MAEQSTQLATSPYHNVESRSVEKCEKLGFRRSQLSRRGSFADGEYTGGNIGRTRPLKGATRVRGSEAGKNRKKRQRRRWEGYKRGVNDEGVRGS